MNLNNNVDLYDSCDNEFNILSILFQDNDCANYQTRSLRVNNNIHISKGNNNSVSLINKSMNEKTDFETFEKVICESDLSELEISQLNILQMEKVYFTQKCRCRKL